MFSSNVRGMRRKKYESLKGYNVKNTAAVPALQSCFEGTNVVQHGTLSHNHLLLVLLCWKTGALGAIPEDATEQEKALSKLFDRAGHWDPAAVAAYDPQVETVFKEGLLMEVLSHKMLQEEPRACSLITQALNCGH